MYGNLLETVIFGEFVAEFVGIAGCWAGLITSVGVFDTGFVLKIKTK